MRLFAAAIFDSAVQAFGNPMFFRTEQEAVRSFRDACEREQEFKAHAADYTFFHLGYYDNDSGQSVNLTAPKLIASAVSLPPDIRVSE